MAAAPDDTLWTSLVGAEVVLDMATPYVILGTVMGCDPLYATLEDADVHDLRDTKTTRDLYVVEARRHGVRCNRRSVHVLRSEIVAISRLSDVIV